MATQDGGTGEGVGGSGAREAGTEPLVQRGDNRFRPVEEEVPEGCFVIGAERSGGAFDPLGARRNDVYRAQDVIAAAEALPGRWLFITLTIDRSKFLNAEMAYQRCQERVRKVAGLLSRIWVASIEPQTKTGEGWTHWHLLVYVPNKESVARCRKLVERAWSIREVIAPAMVDEQTGEVIAREKRVRLSIGRVDVQEAGSVKGTATYVAKYIVKMWPAVPRWMGESTRRQRKCRLSRGFYEVLERLHRHVVHRGGRVTKATTSGRKLKARPLFDRMARSGSRSIVFERTKRGLEFSCVVELPLEELVERSKAYMRVRLGRWGSVRIAVDPRELRRLQRVAESAEGREAAGRYRRLRRCRFECAWDEHQERRAAEGG